MGLDMYAYTAAKPAAENPREIAYWRKHPNLHGWMRRLWERKGNSGEFNGDELELTWEDLDALEQAVREKTLPATGGFFFGHNSDDEYYERDLKFIRDAKAELFLGLRVFYNSSW